MTKKSKKVLKQKDAYSYEKKDGTKVKVPAHSQHYNMKIYRKFPRAKTRNISRDQTKLQKQLQNGSWCDITDNDLIEWILKKNSLSYEELIEKLEKGETIYYDTEWYAEVRIKPTKKEEQEKKKKIEEAQKESLKYQKEEQKRFHKQVGKYDEM